MSMVTEGDMGGDMGLAAKGQMEDALEREKSCILTLSL